jgi:hypothetical protein
MFRRADCSAAVVAASVYLACSLGFAAKAQSAPPNFAPNRNVGWYAYNRIFIPPPSGAGPVQQDPSRPYVNNDEFRLTGRQPTQRFADLSNPILQPWAREVLRKRNELVLSGRLVPARPRVAGRKALRAFCSRQ